MWERGTPSSATMPSVTIDSLSKSLPIGVELSLTIVFTTLYALLFLFIWIQLVLILIYRHKRLSYQSVFLYLCLLWAALRTTLFSFYFKDCSTANRLPLVWKWLLYSLPVGLQYLTLSLIALYFAQAVLKSLTTYEPTVRHRKRRYLFAVFALVNFVFFAINISDAILVENERCCHKNVVLIRVVINQTLFVVTSFALCCCIIKLSRASTGNLLLEGQGTTLCQASVFSVIIGLLYVSRAIYDIAAVSDAPLPSFGYGWINVSDQGEAAGKHGKLTTPGARSYGYVSFVVVLFVWEFLPTFFVVVFFRVRRPQQDLVSILTSNKENRKTYFFDNPHRYDSDDDLPAAAPNLSYDIPGFGSSNGSSGYPIDHASFQPVSPYGSTGQAGFQKTSGSYQGHMHGATPTRLFPQRNANPTLG